MLPIHPRNVGAVCSGGTPVATYLVTLILYPVALVKKYWTKYSAVSIVIEFYPYDRG